MTQFDVFKAVYDLLRDGEPVPAHLRQQAEAHGLRVDALEEQVASLKTAEGEDDIE